MSQFLIIYRKVKHYNVNDDQGFKRNDEYKNESSIT